ncbi:MAG: cellulase family glycosylhydrolase [Pseudomonadota bacterium]
MTSRRVHNAFAASGIVFAAISMCGCGPTFSRLPRHRADTSNPMIHQDGQHLIGLDGKPMQLIAANAGGWLHFESWMWGEPIRLFEMGQHAESPVVARLRELYGTEVADELVTQVHERYVVEADFEAMAHMGFNAVRLPLNHNLLEGDLGFAYLDRAVNWAEAQGVSVVIDMHAAPGGQSDTFPADPDDSLLWEDEDAKQRLVQLWVAIAERYAGRPGVAAYDLLNEPQVADGAQLVELYRRILAAIRAVDALHLVMLEGNNLAVDFTAFQERLDENVVYQAHQYTWFDLDPQDDIDRLAQLAEAHDVPIWMGEFGENHPPEVERVRRAYETAGFAGWAFWPWKRAGGGLYPGLMEIAAPQDFLTLATDLTNGAGTPGQLSTEQARAAVGSFLDAAQPANLRCDDAQAAALGRTCTR